jgi:PadR family transcriptional regulator, regulatory protein AphA
MQIIAYLWYIAVHSKGLCRATRAKTAEIGVLMSLRHAILVTLSEADGTGYEITKRFESGLGHFWQASHQQIYQELKRMADDKLVSVRAVAQETRPTKKIHRITAAGRKELKRWLSVPTKRKPTRNAFLIKLFAAHLVDRDHIITELEAQLAEHRKLLAHYQALEALHFPDPDGLSFKYRCMYLTLTRGMVNERAGIQWCEASLAVFRA